MQGDPWMPTAARVSQAGQPLCAGTPRPCVVANVLGPERRDGTPTEPLSPRTTAELGDLAAQAREWKQRGDVIRAIKLVRTTTGLSLREAKDFVDAL